MTGGQIDDGESAVPESHARPSVAGSALEVAHIVRAPVRDRRGHATQCRAQILARAGRKVSGDAAHY